MHFFAKGQKYYEQVMNHSKVGYSLMFCCNAAGKMLPPMVSGTGILCKIWCNGGPEGTTYAANKSGWFDIHVHRVVYRGRILHFNYH
jgi:hypothetical protein